MAKIKPTADNLSKYGAPLVARFLIGSAADRGTLTYGSAGKRLESQHNFSTIFPLLMKYPAGALMDRFHEIDESLPLINVLLVEAKSDMPGDGIAPYMKARFPELQRRSRSKSADVWRRKFAEAREEVYAYKDWMAAYESAFGPWKGPKPSVQPPERDGRQGDGCEFGKGGEGRHHKNLRLWVLKNPKKVQMKMEMRKKPATEVVLLSGDRADVVYYGQKETLAIEVKSKRSNREDLERGVYQCVKYRAVLEAQPDNAGYKTGALLVTEENLPEDLICLARSLKIKHAVHRVNK